MTCPVEKTVAVALDNVGILYQRERQGAPLDFYLPAYDTHIECKSFPTPRILVQLERAKNVIVIQGIGAARAFASMIGAKP